MFAFPITRHASLISLLLVLPATASSLTVRPEYPQEAAENCIEGWVKVRYKIGAEHIPVDVEVIDAEPEGVFEEATLKAIRHFRQMEDPGTEKVETINWEIEGDCEAEGEDET